MRVTAALLAGLIASVVVGCGTQIGGAADHSPGAGGSRTPKAPGTKQVSCVRLRPGPGQRTVSLGIADNHKSLCVTRGTGVFVFLHSPTSHLWNPIQSSSLALARRPSGVMSLIRGETGAYFVAVGVGSATLTSFDLRCPGGPHGGTGRCPAPLRFSVTVDVLA